MSQEELDEAISLATPGASAVEAIGRVFDEVTFSAKQQIINAGDPMTHVYLIAKVA